MLMCVVLAVVHQTTRATNASVLYGKDITVERAEACRLRSSMLLHYRRNPAVTMDGQIPDDSDSVGIINTQ